MMGKYSGFTILEVIIALGILAGVAAGVMQIFAIGMDRALIIEEESKAYILAESKMDELLLVPLVEEAELSGVFANTELRYNVEISVQEYPGEERSQELLHLLLRVSWGQGDYVRDISLESLKLEAVKK